ncbi:MAG TPA: hypothetical protein VK307_10575 [Thermoleophilaceae bacterium]|nr:hypothetical protein [Thermoleophilaceae bacterium]
MPSDCRPVDAFGIVLIVVAVVAILVAAASYWGSGRMYSGIGESDLVMRREQDSPAAAQDEIRQMLEAKSARRVKRGGEPLDVEAEMRVLQTTHDPALRDEVRQLVIARNERRVRQGREPLDVDAEVERQLRSLGG